MPIRPTIVRHSGLVSRALAPVANSLAAAQLLVDRRGPAPRYELQLVKLVTPAHGGTAVQPLSPPLTLPAAAPAEWLAAIGELGAALRVMLDEGAR